MREQLGFDFGIQAPSQRQISDDILATYREPLERPEDKRWSVKLSMLVDPKEAQAHSVYFIRSALYHLDKLNAQRPTYTTRKRYFDTLLLEAGFKSAAKDIVCAVRLSFLSLYLKP